VRVVLDTNVLISAFIFPGGAPEEVYRRCLEGRLALTTSRTLLAEFGRFLTDKFAWEPERTEEAIAQVARIAAAVEPAERVDVIAADPADDRVLEAAVSGEADVIVSGDSHLLRLRRWRDIRILGPADLLAELEI
jgi:putative PIN family toxin of toxin-antitoxin system